MPWVIGIDEAGYGPNLGPFVMSAVSCRVPDRLVDADLWHVLGAAVRRPRAPDDGRLLLEDSKVVYARPHGLRCLERGVLALLGEIGPAAAPWTGTLTHLLERLCPAAQGPLGEECWYTGKTSVPAAGEPADLALVARQLREASADAGLEWGPVRSVVTCPTRFNAVLDRWGSKGIVLGLALTELLQWCHCPDDGADGVFILVDKHGGRNNYACLLQQAVPDGVVVAEQEGRERSAYRVLGLRRPVRLTFTPRADSAYLCVALASMVSKYLRELLMHEFNRFWQAQVPGLEPTAGYPGDAARFFNAIRAAADQLRVPEASLWRRK
jgi:hypothetical protein